MGCQSQLAGQALSTGTYFKIPCRCHGYHNCTLPETMFHFSAGHCLSGEEDLALRVNFTCFKCKVKAQLSGLPTTTRMHSFDKYDLLSLPSPYPCLSKNAVTMYNVDKKESKNRGKQNLLLQGKIIPKRLFLLTPMKQALHWIFSAQDSQRMFLLGSTSSTVRYNQWRKCSSLEKDEWVCNNPNQDTT